MSPCGEEPKTTAVKNLKQLSTLLRCDLYSTYWLELLNDICPFSESFKNLSEENLLKVLLYGVEHFTFQMNSEILKCTIKFI